MPLDAPLAASLRRHPIPLLRPRRDRPSTGLERLGALHVPGKPLRLFVPAAAGQGSSCPTGCIEVFARKEQARPLRGREPS
jgi:hypothetical protein